MSLSAEIVINVLRLALQLQSKVCYGAREELINPFKCRIKARELLNEKIGIESAICGKCIEVCPVTQLYIKNNIEQTKF